MKTFRKIWKAFWEPLLKSDFVQWVVVLAFALGIRFIYMTSKKQIIGKDVFEKYRNKSAVFVFWHGRSMMLSPIVRKYGFRGYAVTSHHQGGQLMAKLQSVFGLKAIYGSSSKGGVNVLRQGVRILRDGHEIICMSPDGPSGPSMRVKDGALYFARMSGAPIIPVCFTCNRAWFQNRWDRYLIAKPFSKIVCTVGKPVFIKSKTTIEEFEDVRKNLEDVMVQQVRDIDGMFNLFKVEQDQNATDFKKNKNKKK